MSEGTTSEAEVIRLRRNIETQMRRRILEAIEVVLEEELTEALGTGRYERGEARRGYRNGHQARRITTAVGTQTLEVPRGRIVDPDGSSCEFRSQALPRYARRTREVDEAILGAYLAGANTRRIRKALMPLLGEEHLSKSAVSRVASRLKELFRRWSERDLSLERYAIVFLDGFHLKVRMARRVVSVPVLAVLGHRVHRGQFGTGRNVVMVDNQYLGTLFRFARLVHVISGTTPSIDYRAFLSRNVGN